MNKNIYITFGLPGCGKTTVAKYLLNILGNENCVQISPDSIRKELFPISKYDKSTSWKVWEESLVRATDAMKKGKIIVWDAVFGHKHKRQELINKASECGYKCNFVYVFCKNEDSIKYRLDERINDVSDANFEVYKNLKQYFQYPDKDETCIVIDNSFNLEYLHNNLKKYLSI